MHHVDDLKAEAKRIRTAVSEMFNVDVSHSQSLELIAKAKNYPSWNAASAMAKKGSAGVSEKARSGDTASAMLKIFADGLEASFNEGYTDRLHFSVRETEVKAFGRKNGSLFDLKHYFDSLSPIDTQAILDNVPSGEPGLLYTHPLGYKLRYLVSKVHGLGSMEYVLRLQQMKLSLREVIDYANHVPAFNNQWVLLYGKSEELNLLALHSLADHFASKGKLTLMRGLTPHDRALLPANTSYQFLPEDYRDLFDSSVMRTDCDYAAVHDVEDALIAVQVRRLSQAGHMGFMTMRTDQPIEQLRRHLDGDVGMRPHLLHVQMDGYVIPAPWEN